MEAVGQLAGGIAHDFNNLLQAILSYSEFLAEGLAPESELQQDVAEVQKAAHRAAGLTRQLLVFSRHHVTEPMLIDLNDIRPQCRTPDAQHAGRGHPARVPDGGGALPRAGRPRRARTAPDEPRHQCPGRHALWRRQIQSRLTPSSSETRATGLERPRRDPSPASASRDNGEGMTPEVAAKAFEPFFTTKETGRGSGLGLAMVYGIANRAGGSTSISTVGGVGTTITVLFPLSDEASLGSTPDGGRQAQSSRWRHELHRDLPENGSGRQDPDCRRRGADPPLSRPPPRPRRI